MIKSISVYPKSHIVCSRHHEHFQKWENREHEGFRKYLQTNLNCTGLPFLSLNLSLSLSLSLALSSSNIKRQTSQVKKIIERVISRNPDAA